MSRLKKLITEIHRRSLWQVLLIYIGAAWACFELIDAVTERLGLPAWLPGLAIVLFLLALPVVLATAFVREEPAVTAPPPEATEAEAREAEAGAAAARHEARRRHRFLKWRNAVASFVVALAVWGVVAAGWMLFGTRVGAETERKMIVVLPFDNLGATDDEYFADGLTDAINARLASIQGLGMISRQSAIQYKGSAKTAKQIGAELGVDYILEGTVQAVRYPE